MTGDYALKVPARDGLYVPVHRSSTVFLGVTTKCYEIQRTYGMSIESTFPSLRWIAV